MSNPFLADLEESYTPYSGSGTSTPYSGGQTPKRRNSTNPFEILSPDQDDQDGQNQLNFASAIADLSADFFQSISAKTANLNNNDNNEFDEDVFGDADADADDENNQVEPSNKKTVKTVTTTYDNGAVFDPFQTINDDDVVNQSSKRSSIETANNSQQPKVSTLTNEDDSMMMVASGSIPKEALTKSSKAKEMFSSSMTEMELLATHKVAQQQQQQQQQSVRNPEESPRMLSPTGLDHLSAPPQPSSNMDLSDLSDLSDASPINAPNDIRSAFEAYSAIDDDLPTNFTPITSSEILLRRISKQENRPQSQDSPDDDDDDDARPMMNTGMAKKDDPAGFDPFTTVYNDSPINDGQPQQEIISVEDDDDNNYGILDKMAENPVAPSIARLAETQRSDSIDLNDIGQPNQNAQGIINDAFDEQMFDAPKQQEQPLKQSSVDIAEVDIENIQPNSLRELVTNMEEGEEGEEEEEKATAATMAEEVVVDSSQQPLPPEILVGQRKESRDPFDTSGFDSKAFEAFESRFKAADQDENKVTNVDDCFASPYKSATNKPNENDDDDDANMFDTFEPFVVPKQPENTPFKVAKKPKKKRDSFEDSDSFDDYDDDEPEESFRIVIRAKDSDQPQTNTDSNLALPLLPPPPKSPKRVCQPTESDEQYDAEDMNEDELILTGYRTKMSKPKKTAKSFLDEEFERFFAKTENRRGSESTGEAGATSASSTMAGETEWPTTFGELAGGKQRRASNEIASPASPQTPLYDEDTSQPLEDFPPPYLGDGWEMMLRHPAKKKLTANRYWKKVFVRFLSDTCVLQLFNKKDDQKPFQELPMQASYSLSEISPQQYDQYGKIFTIKVQYVFYRERVGVRPGQLAKVMQGQIQSMGDLARIGMPVEHSPQISELLKLGTLEYNDVKEFVNVVEEAMFRMPVHRDRALTYRTEEIQCSVQDECYVEQNKLGIIEKQLARVRIFFLAFLNGMPVIEVGINDLRRQGKEVVGRHDILPVVTEEWIRVERAEFHSCVQDAHFEISQIIRLIPPDACQFEMMRFRVRPPKNRELPLQVSAYMNITPTKMELKCDVLVPGCISRKHGQIPCEDIAIRFHIPECWVYFFRVEKHFRYGAVHSTNRRSGKLKGLDRILGTATNPEPQLIEVTAGLAKYEHAYHSIVWRIPKLPKEGQGAYTQQLMMVRLPLSSFDRIPETFNDTVYVEFRMPSTTVSHTTLRSISVNCEQPPEKYVRYLAKYEYKVGLNISFDENKQEPEYLAATKLNNGSVKNGGSGSGSGGGGQQVDTEHSSEEEPDDQPEE